MEQIRQSRFKNSFFDWGNHIFMDVWLPASVEMHLDEFQAEVVAQTKLIGELGTKLVLLNATDFGYAVVPDVQDWVVENIFSQWIRFGVKKVAVMVSAELVPQLSVEQTFSEEKSNNFQTLYFDSQAKATDWLLGKA
jgi:hypothetical protein